MTTQEIIIQMFCFVDDAMPALPKHPQARLYPSELVTIGLLFALKGGHFRAFYRWLSRDYAALFAGLPERSRLQRLLQAHQDWCQHLLAAPTFFTVIDSYPIELLFPIRAGRTSDYSHLRVILLSAFYQESIYFSLEEARTCQLSRPAACPVPNIIFWVVFLLASQRLLHLSAVLPDVPV